MNAGIAAGLLVDTNLLVLYAVGRVNRFRIETFKRTRQYTIADYDLLIDVLKEFQPLYTVAHVMAEVSNLTDLPGPERLEARRVVKETILLLEEVGIPSSQAADDPLYNKLGLSDAAICVAARRRGCSVLTDDLDLYRFLSYDKIPVLNFTYIRARGLEV